MTQVTLYKEIITKSPVFSVGGPKLPFRSVRASAAGVRVTVDRNEHHHLRTLEPRVIDLPPGRHLITARRRGFVGGALEVDIVESEQPIVVVSPDHRVSATSATPLGTLRVHTVSGPQELLPYRFYKAMPSSWGHDSVIYSVGVSVLASGLFVAIGLGSLVAVAIGFSKGIGVGLFLMCLAAVIAPFTIAGGFVGILTAIRFVRLPRSWRKPVGNA